MNKFSCTRSLGEEIYYATLIAENEQQARDMALEETNKKWSRSGGRAREWSVRVLESGVEGPPASSIAATARHELRIDIFIVSRPSQMFPE
jgi:hypothetical protein